MSEKFDTWSKKAAKLAKHNSCDYHKFALVKMEALKSALSQPSTSIELWLKIFQMLTLLTIDIRESVDSLCRDGANVRIT